ncbi:hypothetical protein AQAU111925_13145 [Aquirufa aurantiipilula]
MVPVKAIPVTCGLARLTASLLKLFSVTVTDKRSTPPADMVPSVASIIADSALYNTIEAVATPLLKFKLVPVPKSVEATVGAVAGLVELVAPEKVIV